MNKCQSQFRVRTASDYNLPPRTLTQKTHIVPRQRYPRGDRSSMVPAQRCSSRWRSSVDFRRKAGFRWIRCCFDLRSIRWCSGQCSFSTRADYRVPTKSLTGLYCFWSSRQNCRCPLNSRRSSDVEVPTEGLVPYSLRKMLASSLMKDVRSRSWTFINVRSHCLSGSSGSSVRYLRLVRFFLHVRFPAWLQVPDAVRFLRLVRFRPGCRFRMPFVL